MIAGIALAGPASQASASAQRTPNPAADAQPRVKPTGTPTGGCGKPAPASATTVGMDARLSYRPTDTSFPWTLSIRNDSGRQVSISVSTGFEVIARDGTIVGGGEEIAMLQEREDAPGQTLALPVPNQLTMCDRGAAVTPLRGYRLIAVFETGAGQLAASAPVAVTIENSGSAHDTVHVKQAVPAA